MTYQIHNSTPCRPGIPSASDYIFPISPSFKNSALPHSVPKKPPYSVGSSDMMTSQASDGVTNNGNAQYHEIAKLRISLRLLTMMALATGVSSITSLQFFLQVNWSTMIKKYVTLKEFYQTIGDIGETLDVAVLVCSCSAFFVTLMQLFFVLKLQKFKNSHATIFTVRFYSRAAALCHEPTTRSDLESNRSAARCHRDGVLRRRHTEVDSLLEQIHSYATHRRQLQKLLYSRIEQLSVEQESYEGPTISPRCYIIDVCLS
ncbi:unnamed protein product [Angiostrongylus costaricensis]|uniref:Miff domain-containing protein n=1 Tax=Angiostrongylus costaricensis TaxID=334426 RepID=A0A158PMC2_ANGCS|nr:unnamed protein product [Angiostrongylus costaricensis]